MSHEPRFTRSFIAVLGALALAGCTGKVLELDSTSGAQTVGDAAVDLDADADADAATSIIADGGADVELAVDGGPSCFGNAMVCVCTQAIDAHAYAMRCAASPDGGSSSCTCLVDGTIVSTFVGAANPTTEVWVCVDEFTAPRTGPLNGCNFP